MSLSQPPVSDDQVVGAWDFEVTTQFNQLEQRLVSLLDAIRDATDLDDLKERVEEL